MSAPPPPKKPGLSLYRELLEPDKQQPHGSTISGAPVRYDVKKDGGNEDPQRKKDASLKFQPIKRPQVQQKARPKGTPPSSSIHKLSSSVNTVSASSPDQSLSSSTPSHQQPSFQKSNFEDWVGDDDDGYHYQDRSRASKKKKKKNKGQGQGQETRTWDWDDIYDPTLPNNYADYKGSDEQYRDIRDWKARLYYRQLKEAKKQSRRPSDQESDRPRPTNKIFAPPPQLSFAPPSFDDSPRPPLVDDDDDDYYPPSSNSREAPVASNAPSSYAPASVPDDASGEDAFSRRMRMSGAMLEPPPPPPPPAIGAIPPVATPQPVLKTASIDMAAKKAEALAKIAAFKAKLQKPVVKPEAAPTVASPPKAETAEQVSEAPPPPPPPPPSEEPGSSISRAPVRYELPPPPPELENVEDVLAEEDTSAAADQPRSNRPGKKGFAERLLKKYGWEKGQGLGSQGDGITTALVGKVEKRKKRSDAEGGGWAQPANMGKIVGGKRRKVDENDPSQQSEQDARFGTISSVIKLEGMLTGLDVQKEIMENNLMQEVGDEMGSKYGNVERVFIWREEMGGGDEVFVKFTSQLSALRAVNATDGMTFAENEVRARFWSEEMFENGEYGDVAS